MLRLELGFPKVSPNITERSQLELDMSMRYATGSYLR